MITSPRFFSLGFAISIALIAAPHAALASGPGGTPGSSGPTTGPVGGGPGSSGITLCLSKEATPAGALVQMKVIATEPKPISTGTGSFSLAGFDSLVGIAVSQDTIGTAVVRGDALAVSLISPAALLGNSLEYPILTVVGHVPAGAAIGTQFPLLIDPSTLQILDPAGVPYPTSFQPGQVLINSGVAISDVLPGSAVVPAGSTVSLSGVNFNPGTTVQFADVVLSSVQYISPNRIDVTVSATATMHGMKITATNPDGSTSTYFSYQRTYPMSPSADPVMQLVMPLLPPNEVASATINLPAPSAGTTLGVALQNVEASDVVATVELLDAACKSLASTQVTVSASHFAVRELGELFGDAALVAARVRVTSPLPIEVAGVAANQISGTAQPIPAQ
ncbi:MAG TPA: hypothetical protein VEZ11_07615 [Thermoanaerobaculia bacterium]|nr:hypothetical protein [Thermoanaerobaculia bacterium]